MLNGTIKDILKADVVQVKLLMLLFACDLFRRISSLMLEAASSSIFLFEFSGNYLPVVFMFTAVFMAIGALHFLNIKNMPAVACAFTLMGMAAITLLLYLIYIGQYTEFASMALMVWKNVCFLLSEITFLLVALKFCKYDWKDWRFIAILLTEAAAMIVSGLAVTVLVFFITPQSIIAISSVLLFVAGIFLLFVSRYSDTERVHVRKSRIKSTIPVLKQKRLVLAFFLTMGLFIFGGYIIEYGFYKSVYNIYGERWLSDMTAFFAMYHVFAGILVVAITVMFVRFESLEGLCMTVLTLPFFILAGSAGALTASMGILSLSRMGKDIIYRLVMTPIAKFFSVPLLPALRKQLSFIRRIWVEPASIFLAGLFLYFLEDILNFGWLSCILLVNAAAVAVMAYVTYRLYNSVALDSLRKHSWKKGKLFLEDKKVKDFVLEKLLSLDVYDTIYYLRMLEDAYGIDSKGYIIYALNHPSESVRIFALRQLEKTKEEMALPAVLKVIEQDGSKNVRCAALQTYCVIGGKSVYGYVEPFLDTELMEGAAIGLIKSSPDGAFIAAMKVARLIESDDKQDRIKVANILGKASGNEYYLPLKKLMYDEDKDVRIAAVSAASNLKNCVFANDFITFLKDRDLKEYALEGLIRMGDSALPFLAKEFVYPENRRILPKMTTVISYIGGNKAQEILIGNLKKVSAYMRLVILQNILSKGYKFTFFNQDALMEVWHFEVNRKNWIEASLRDLEKDLSSEQPCLYILSDALQNEKQQSIKTIELLRQLLNCNKDITVDFQLSFTHKDNAADTAQKNLSSRLSDIIINKNSLHQWTRAAAIYCAGYIKDISLYDVIRQAAETDNTLLKETALWALNAMDFSVSGTDLTDGSEQNFTFADSSKGEE